MHNPEYTDFLARGGMAAREPGDRVCGGLPTYISFRNSYLHFLDTAVSVGRPLSNHWLGMSSLRLAMHLQDVELQRLAPPRAHEDGMGNRVNFLLGRMTEDVWKRLIKKQSKARDKRGEMYSVVRMYVDTATVVWNQFLNKHREYDRLRRTTQKQKSDYVSEQVKRVESLDELVEIFNTAMSRISKSYGKQVTLRIVTKGNIKSNNRAERLAGKIVEVVTSRG